MDVLVVAAAPSAGTLDPSTLSDPDVVLDGVAAKAMTFLRLAQAVLPGMREAVGRRGSGLRVETNRRSTDELRRSVESNLQSDPIAIGDEGGTSWP